MRTERLSKIVLGVAISGGMVLISTGVHAGEDDQDSKKDDKALTGASGTQPQPLQFTINRWFNASGSIFLNIDSDNDDADDQMLQIVKNTDSDVGGSPLLTVTESGDLGIGTGTTIPQARLDVVTDSMNTGNNTARFSAPNLGGRTSHIHWGLTGDWYIRSADVAGDVLIQDNGGNVGIGTASPLYPLHVQGSSQVAVFATSASGTGIVGEATATTGAYIGVLGISESSLGHGLVGIASADTGVNYGVHARSDSREGRGVYGLATSSTGTNFGVYGRSNSTSGFDFYAGGAGTNYGASSSRRWKHNVVHISEPLSKIAQLRGVYFDWDEEHGGAHDVGMIAEEVGEVMPEIVQYEANGVDAIGMDYSKMTPLLVEALNALREETDREIDRLHSEIADLKMLVAHLAALQQEDSK